MTHRLPSSQALPSLTGTASQVKPGILQSPSVHSLSKALQSSSARHSVASQTPAVQNLRQTVVVDLAHVAADQPSHMSPPQSRSVSLPL